VLALDASTGNVIWKFQHQAPAKAALGSYAGVVNRGLAMLGDKVFFATSDARLVALSASNGTKVWESTIEEDLNLYTVTGAPLAYKDLVVTGITTKGAGRGGIVAYDAATGKERWRFHSIPGEGEAGRESWSGDSWRNGGASTWLTGSYDAENDILYWGVGNPKPDYAKAIRMGDNLFSNSVVALRGSTGKLLWYFQFSPGDNHDWDAAQIPVLVNRDSSGAQQKLLLWANRNGFFYVLDRISGKFLRATPFVQQTWAERIDSNGRPVLKPTNSKGKDGVMTFPSNKGGTNWWSPSFDQNLNLIFIPVLETGMIFFPQADVNSPPASAGSLYTAVRALDPSTGKMVWEHRNPTRYDDNTTGGLLSTQGGVVFGSDMSNFFALDSSSGKTLWSIDAGEKIEAAPVTFMQGGAQHIVIAAGGNLLAFVLPKH
jgi:alcohol dehydrogenase (cytochrome c)